MFTASKTEIEGRKRKRERKQEATVLEGREKERVIGWVREKRGG